jgi:hypothetical protein
VGNEVSTGPFPVTEPVIVIGVLAIVGFTSTVPPVPASLLLEVVGGSGEDGSAAFEIVESSSYDSAISDGQLNLARRKLIDDSGAKIWILDKGIPLIIPDFIV